MFGDGFLSWLEDELVKRRMTLSRPERIILVRHGLSEGNIDRSAYSRTPDSQIPLTERGFAQAAVAGLQIRQLVGNESIRIFYSPYLRARQTMLAILRAFDGQSVQISSEPRLREQDFGNFQDPEKMDQRMRERQQFGRFYFRFPNGEAGTDVYDRMASFITYLFRSMGEKGSFEVPGVVAKKRTQPVNNYVLVTHGLLMRIFCMCYLRWTVSEFEQVWNPSNCEIWVLQKIPDGSGRYELAGRWRATPYRGRFSSLKFGKGKRERLFEHMKRPLVARVVTPGDPDALKDETLRGLADIPGPSFSRPRSKKGKKKGILSGDEVLAYWGRGRPCTHAAETSSQRGQTKHSSG